MGSLFLLANSIIIGIIAVIAVISISMAICFYLISLKDKENKE